MNHKEEWTILVSNIRKARALKGYTQKVVAEKLFISLIYYKQIEAPNFHKSFSLDLLFSISKVLEVAVSDLFKKES